MTKVEIQKKAAKYHEQLKGFTDNSIEAAYKSGTFMVLESDEYINMKEDADNWNNYNEELKSLQNKLSVQWEKVEKWDKLVAEVEKQRAGEENMYAEDYGYIIMDMLKIKDDS